MYIAIHSLSDLAAHSNMPVIVMKNLPSLDKIGNVGPKQK